ncbi:MAG: phosphotransferase [Ilumatobacter sp.]|uniref:phosphotransferase n=1 Tax=Ilumatobacter sp. TaxID=1967498 RepID=UPI0032999761
MTDEPGPLLASGRAADVFDLGDGRVLRRYREHHDVDVEVRAMRYVAERGFPVPNVHSADGSDLVMDLIAGPTMLEALEAAPWKVVWHARRLARLQRRLTRIKAPDWLLADSTSVGSARTHRPQSVLHLDLHPMNVILSRKGPVVIDWTNVAGGPAGFDGALTFVIISTSATSTPRDRFGQQAFARSFRWFRGKRVIEPFLEAACDHRLADRGILPDERVAVAALRTRLRK